MSTSKIRGRAFRLGPLRERRPVLPQLEADLGVDEDGLAANVLAGVISVAAEADVHTLEVEPVLGRARRSVIGLGRVERQRLAGAAHRHVPRIRRPLRRQVERLDAHVGQADALEAPGQPLRALGVGGRPDDAAPELRVAGVAIPARDLGLGHHVLVHAAPVDRRECFGAGRQRPMQQSILGRRRIGGGTDSGKRLAGRQPAGE